MDSKAEVDALIKKTEQECIEKVDAILNEYNCTIKAEFILSESGISPILKIVYNGKSNR